MAPNKVETVVGTKLKAFFVAIQEFRKHKRSENLPWIWRGYVAEEKMDRMKRVNFKLREESKDRHMNKYRELSVKRQTCPKLPTPKIIYQGEE